MRSTPYASPRRAGQRRTVTEISSDCSPLRPLSWALSECSRKSGVSISSTVCAVAVARAALSGWAEAGSRPGGRVAFLLCGKKVTKETHPAVPGLRPTLDFTTNKRPVSKLATLEQRNRKAPFVDGSARRHRGELIVRGMSGGGWCWDWLGGYRTSVSTLFIR